jgi:phosphatidylethanolamine-binding protein (PEBP) family uncharacterized protein
VIDRPPKLTVTSPAFQNGGDIPFENTQYRGNKFPGLGWTAGPANTKSYAVIMQDTDAMMRGAPILHWTMVNIPGTATKLEALPLLGAARGVRARLLAASGRTDEAKEELVQAITLFDQSKMTVHLERARAELSNFPDI